MYCDCCTVLRCQLVCCSANDEIDKVRRQNQVETTRLQAALKRAELQVQSLEQANEQKVRTNWYSSS
jgi:tellurite resistance protein